MIASGAEERIAGLQVNMVDFVVQTNMEESGKKGKGRWRRQAGPPAALVTGGHEPATSRREGVQSVRGREDGRLSQATGRRG